MSLRQQLSGYVLHKRAYRETSLLVDFFTLEQGKVGAVAKGARGNSKSDRKSLLQALQKNEFELSGRSNLKNLGRLESLSPAVKLSGNALYCAFYINEVLSRALPEAEPVADLFIQYEFTLNQMAQCDQGSLQQLEPLLREFELALLLCLGYLPDFEYDAERGEAINSDLSYTFTSSEGFTTCMPDIKTAIRGEFLIAISQGSYKESSDPELRKALKLVCRQALQEIIGDKPIKSRELFVARS